MCGYIALQYQQRAVGRHTGVNPSPMFLCIVIIAATAVLCYWMVTGAVDLVEDTRKNAQPRSEFGSYAPDCSEFEVEYTDDDWDSETDTYKPLNREWASCMGVGYRNSHSQMYRKDL